MSDDAQAGTAADAQADAQRPRHRQHWQDNLKLTAALMLVWVLVSFGVAYFARDLNFNFFGWPFSFWVAAQGALLVYLGIVVAYARRMRALDVEHGVAEEP